MINQSKGVAHLVKKKKKQDVEEEIKSEGSPDESTEPEDVVVVEAEPEEELSETELLKQEIENLKEQVASEENKYLKMLAEFENFKRRNKQEADMRNKYKEQALAEDLLSVIDNLERALSVEDDEQAFSSLKKGVDMVYKEFIKVFESHDIKPIESVGVAFDPNVHQAVMTEKDDNVESNIVIEEFQKGYLLKDRVIRPSMVKVSE